MIPVYPWERTSDAQGRAAWVTRDPCDPDRREVWVVRLDGVPVWRYVVVHCWAGALRRESWADQQHRCTAASATVAARMATDWMYGRVAPIAWQHLTSHDGVPVEEP